MATYKLINYNYTFIQTSTVEQIKFVFLYNFFYYNCRTKKNQLPTVNNVYYVHYTKIHFPIVYCYIVNGKPIK